MHVCMCVRMDVCMHASMGRDPSRAKRNRKNHRLCAAVGARKQKGEREIKRERERQVEGVLKG